MKQLSEPSPARTLGRLLAAVGIGLIGSVVIWVAAPYNNFIIAASYIADSYLPIAALALTLLLVMGVNPLLHWWWPRLALRKWQLAVCVGMFFTACVLPGQGLLRMLPYCLAGAPLQVRADKTLSDAYRDMDLPPSLFPGPTAYGADTPVSDYFITELPPGEPVPWGAWLGPLATWGTFLTFSWLMMAGLALIVMPQWRRNERLSFPLLTVQEALIEEPDKGTHFAPLFRKRAFWIAALAVLALHLLAGAKVYAPQAIPAIPLSWDLGRLFTEEPLRYLPYWIYRNRIYFILIGVAFFIPSRISFSIWTFTLAYAAYGVISSAYFPPSTAWPASSNHRAGAIVAMTICILWLGRKHWANVLGSLFRRAGDEEARANRRAALMFLGGLAGMWAFLAWAGVGRPAPGSVGEGLTGALSALGQRILWPTFYVGFAFMVSILIARVVAETGIPFIRIDPGSSPFIRLVPLKFLGPASLYFSTVIAILFSLASRVSFAATGTHAIGLDRDASPRWRSRLALGLVAMLLVGLAISGGAHLWYNYHHSASLDGRQNPVGQTSINELSTANDQIVAVRAKRPLTAAYNEPAHLAFGAGLAGLLYILCMVLPKWPLHPVGLLMVNTFYGEEGWVSIFIGWLLQSLIVRYGGARLYRKAIPVFLGLIMGEVFAAVFWGLEPAVRVMLDLPYRVVPVTPF